MRESTTARVVTAIGLATATAIGLGVIAGSIRWFHTHPVAEPLRSCAETAYQTPCGYAPPRGRP
jgi:ABC-type nitrate/sulfonate/bicarbonate transport system permease component